MGEKLVVAWRYGHGAHARHEVSFEVLGSYLGRMRGLLGTTPSSGRPVALRPCQSIHTVGMRYAIDVALVGTDGAVLDARRAVRPGCLVSHRLARLALERPASDAPWPSRGDVLDVRRRDGPG